MFLNPSYVLMVMFVRTQKQISFSKSPLHPMLLSPVHRSEMKDKSVVTAQEFGYPNSSPNPTMDSLHDFDSSHDFNSDLSVCKLNIYCTAVASELFH